MDGDIINYFFESKKNANCILELEKNLLSDETNKVKESIIVVKNLFKESFRRKLFKIKNNDANDLKYREWLISRYRDFIQHLISFLSFDDKEIQENALETLMAFVTFEKANPPRKLTKKEYYFPTGLFHKIVFGGLALHDIEQQILISKFQNYLSEDDIKMHLLKVLLDIMQKVRRVTDVFLLNCFFLLNTIKYPKEFSTNEDKKRPKNLPVTFQLKEKPFCELFSSCWYMFLKFKMPPSLLKKVLVILHKRVIPHLENPCLLTDFLTDAYNQGGLLSLLALNGLFFLMDRYNVEYSNFFEKLYSLFDVDIVNGKFSARFFCTADLFLSSMHLPSHVVAAFVKRLSRIALYSSTDVILRIIPFICNLLIRHPTLSTLIHRKDGGELSNDPFDFDATKPADSKAMDSSLWEIQTLQSHLNPDVSRKAKLINKEMPRIQFDISSILDQSLVNMYTRERKRKFTDGPAAVCRNPKLERWSSISV